MPLDLDALPDAPALDVEALPDAPSEDNLGVYPMASREQHMAVLHGEPVSLTAYKAARGPAPEQASQALKLARDRGVSPQFAADNADVIRQAQEQSGFEDALGASPVLAAYAGQSGVHASAVKDDVTALQALEMGFADVGYAMTARRYMDDPSKVDEAGLAGYEQTAAEFGAKVHGIQDPIDRLAADVARSIPTLGVLGASTVLGKGKPGLLFALHQLNRGVLYRRILNASPVPTADERALDASLEGKDTSDEQYATWAKERSDFEAKAKEFATKGAIAGATAALVSGEPFVMALPGVNDLLRKISQDIVAKSVTEAIVTRGTEWAGHTLSGMMMMGAQAVADDAAVQKATTGKIDYGKAVETGKDVFLGGFDVAAVLASVSPGRAFLRDMGRVKSAPADVARLDGLVEQVKDSKLAQRSPEEAETLLGQMAAKGDSGTVYVAAEAAAKNEVAARLVEALADEGRAVAEAQATGADVPVPTEKYLLKLGELHETIREDVKFTPDGASLREARDFLDGPVSKLLAERTMLDREPDSPAKREAMQALHEKMRDAIASQYRVDPAEYAKAFNEKVLGLAGRVVEEAKPAEEPVPVDAMGWARKLANEKPISDLQPGRYETAARRAEDKLAQIATQAAEKGQEAARQAFTGAGTQGQETPAPEAGKENLRKAGKKADTAAKKLAEVPMLERARDLARAQAKVHEELAMELEKAREYIAKRDTEKGRAELGKAAPEYLEAFNAIRDSIDEQTPRALPNPNALDALLLRMDREGESIGFDADAVRDLLTKPRGWKALTTPQALAALDFVKNIRSAARHMNEITLADRKLSLRERVTEVRAHLDALKVPDSGLPAPSRASEGKIAGAVRTVKEIGAEGLQAFEILRRLGMGDAYDDFVKARNTKSDLSTEVGEPVWKMYEKDLPKALKKSRFDGVEGPGSPVFKDNLWTRQDLWNFTSWWGSESGSDRIKRGLRITDAQAHEFMSQLRNAEADFIDAKSKLNDELLWPKIRDHTREASGVVPKKVEARPFTIRTAEGDIRELRGGYEPARYRSDAESTSRAPEEAESIADYWGGLKNGFPSTARSFLKERLQQVGKVPDLNWSTYSSHVESVLHYLAYDDFVRNFGRILRDSEFRELVQHRLGAQELLELDKFLTVAARGRVESAKGGAQRLDQFLGNGFRGRLAASVFHANPVIAFGDLAHIPGSMIRLKLGPQDTLYGLSQALDPTTWGRSDDGSQQLPYRWKDMGWKLRRQLANIGPGDKPLSRKWLDAAGSLPYHVADGFISKFVFEAAASKAERAGATPEEAKRAGDHAIAAVMPPLNLAEQSSFARDRGTLGALLLVRGYPNQLYNMGAAMKWDAQNAIWQADPGWEKAKVALGVGTVTAAAFLGMIWSEQLLGNFLMGHGKEHDESWGQWFARQMISAPFYPLPLVSDAADVVTGAAVSRKSFKQELLHGHRSIRQAPALGLLESAIRDLGEAVSGRTDMDKAYGAMGLAALALGVGRYPLRPLRFTTDLMLDRTSPRGPFDVAGGFAYGRRRRQAKNPATLLQDFASGDY